MTYATREEWLSAAISKIGPMVEDVAERKLPEKLAAIVSWPKGKNSAIGQCFPATWTDDGTVYTTFSPVLGKCVVTLLATVAHELVHAVGEMNHGKGFKKVATGIGLTGKMTATSVSAPLAEKLTRIGEELGPYPHVVLSKSGFGGGDGAGRGTATERETWPYCVSPVDPSYKVKISPRLVQEYGPPTCPISGKPMIVRAKAR